MIGGVQDGQDHPGDPNDLYAVDPAEFTAARTVLVRELKAAGDKDAAAAVAAMRKPPRTAWALNRLARESPETVAGVLDAAAGVATALQGTGDDLRQAQGAYTGAVAAAVDAAAAVGDVSAEPMRARLRATLLAAGADPGGEVAGELRAGRLAEDHDAPGLSVLAVGGLHAVPEERAERPRRAGGAKIGRGRGRARSAGAAEKDRPSARGAAADGATDDAAAADLDDEAARAEEAEAERAAERRRELIRRRRSLERDLDRLRKRAQRLDQGATEAEAKAQDLRSDADEAAAAVEQGEAELAELIDEAGR